MVKTLKNAEGVKEKERESVQKMILTLDEAVSFMGVSRSYMYKLTSQRKIPHYKPTGKLVYFKRDELEAWLLQNKVSTHNELESKAQSYCLRK